MVTICSVSVLSYAYALSYTFYLYPSNDLHPWGFVEHDCARVEMPSVYNYTCTLLVVLVYITVL